MEFGRHLTVLGISLASLGILFHLQGQSVVGPESSFMYSSPEWASYGLAVALAGMALAGAAIWLGRRPERGRTDSDH